MVVQIDWQALLGGPWPMPLVGSVWLMLREGGVTTMHRVLHAISPVYGSALLSRSQFAC